MTRPQALFWPGCHSPPGPAGRGPAGAATACA